MALLENHLWLRACERKNLVAEGAGRSSVQVNRPHRLGRFQGVPTLCLIHSLVLPGFVPIFLIVDASGDDVVSTARAGGEPSPVL